jgi:hypothetical protein
MTSALPSPTLAVRFMKTYLTHRISDHFMLKGSYIDYDYAWSGSGRRVGAPNRLNSTPILAFPTYDIAKIFTFGLIASFQKLNLRRELAGNRPSQLFGRTTKYEIAIPTATL